VLSLADDGVQMLKDSTYLAGAAALSSIGKELKNQLPAEAVARRAVSMGRTEIVTEPRTPAGSTM
jgi:hypothetical protein